MKPEISLFVQNFRARLSRLNATQLMSQSCLVLKSCSSLKFYHRLPLHGVSTEIVPNLCLSLDNSPPRGPLVHTRSLQCTLLLSSRSNLWQIAETPSNNMADDDGVRDSAGAQVFDVPPTCSWILEGELFHSDKMMCLYV